MGNYLNPTSKGFRECLQSQIYVDKSNLISYTNSVIDTQQKYICVSRPRRFGKSMAASMMAAYYSSGTDSSELFCSLKISWDAFYEKYRNKYDVIMVNIQEFLSNTDSAEEMIRILQGQIIRELCREYPDIDMDKSHLVWAMKDVFAATGRSFVILIDEWDCLFREYQKDTDSQKKYLDFLRSWLKDQVYVSLAYMTGILPIKKYGSHSALNMFSEYSVTNPGKLSEFFGFTVDEVKDLCEKYTMNFEETRAWYDGYNFALPDGNEVRHISIYSPKSVVEAMIHREFLNYWSRTETYEALQRYIQMNYDGLKDSIVTMIAGGSVPIDINGFSNDMTTFSCADDVLTLLTHLGYLSYDSSTKSVSIPNKEVNEEYLTAIRRSEGWGEVVRSVNNSQKLLQALWDMDGEAVAEGIDCAHQEVSILQYNDENALSYTVNLAFYAAKEYYTFIRELPSGRGFADICLIPRRKYIDKPAILIELKWDKSAQGAITQIKNKNYIASLEEYSGDLLITGINYDKATKKHRCVIERITVSQENS